MIPENIKQAVATLDPDDLPGTLADGIQCEGAAFHSPTPLVVDAYPLHGGEAWLCPTCAANLIVLRRLIEASPEPLPWPLRREFGNKIRALAQQSEESDDA